MLVLRVCLTSWMSGLIHFLEADLFFFLFIFTLCLFKNISFVVRLACCYLQNKKQLKRVKCFQFPKTCKEGAQCCFSLKLFWVYEVLFKNSVYIDSLCIFCSSHPSFFSFLSPVGSFYHSWTAELLAYTGQRGKWATANLKEALRSLPRQTWRSPWWGVETWLKGGQRTLRKNARYQMSV